MTLLSGPTEERQYHVQDSALTFFQVKRNGGMEGSSVEGPLTPRLLVAICQMAGRSDMARGIFQQSQAGSLDMERATDIVFVELQRLERVSQISFDPNFKKGDPRGEEVCEAYQRLLHIQTLLLTPYAKDADLAYINAALSEGGEANTLASLQNRIFLMETRRSLKDMIQSAKQAGTLSVRHLVAICQILNRFDLAQEIRRIVKGGGKDGVRQAFQFTMRAIDEHLLQSFESGVIPAILALLPTDSRLVEINKQVTAGRSSKECI